jgi:2-succinyl-5-enolpyruvyl-6-hydroxy-3-cyclohexene-1-carboxylate synthase
MIDSGRANLVAASAFVDALASNGVRHAVVCPGSRSTPLAVTLAAHPNVRVWVHIDERAAAFFALGMARQLGESVAILSTSGTAAANFLPAIVEARLSRVPLIALTADRPPELRDWGAAQTIDQLRLYGEHVKWFADMPVPTADEAISRHARATAARAAQTARSEPAGPVHLNFPFREPLLPPNLKPSTQFASLFEKGRGPERTTTLESSSLHPDEGVIAELAALVAAEPLGIVVCGPGEAGGLASAVTGFSAASGYPILADPLSGLRFGPHDRSHVIDGYDPFLRDQATANALRPDVVIRVGAIPTSKPLQQFLAARSEMPQFVIDPGMPRDPSHVASRYVRANAAVTLAAVAERLARTVMPADRDWLDAWKRANCVTRNAIDQSLSRDELFEGRAAADIAAVVPEDATLVVGNSMPIRDIDAFVCGDQRRLRIVSNRGANGIDGVMSTALGAAAVSDGPVVLLIGDLSFVHDLNGMLAAKLFDLDATVVVVNNNGGGIFSFLPQAEQLDGHLFETLFGTPTGFDIGTAARLFGASYARPATWLAFRRDLCNAIQHRGLSIVEVVTDRDRNVVQHRAVWAAVANALRSDAGTGH